MCFCSESSSPPEQRLRRGWVPMHRRQGPTSSAPVTLALHVSPLALIIKLPCCHDDRELLRASDVSGLSGSGVRSGGVPPSPSPRGSPGPFTCMYVLTAVCGRRPLRQATQCLQSDRGIPSYSANFVAVYRRAALGVATHRVGSTLPLRTAGLATQPTVNGNRVQ
jgi:hypothetical protein